MATCGECLHFEDCLNENQQTRYYGEKEACNNVQDLCRYFLPKSGYVKRERGEWKIEEYPKQNKKWLICSNCTAVIDCNEIQIDENEFDFCPYCSADMRKEDNNER